MAPGHAATTGQRICKLTPPSSSPHTSPCIQATPQALSCTSYALPSCKTRMQTYSHRYSPHMHARTGIHPQSAVSTGFRPYLHASPCLTLFSSSAPNSAHYSPNSSPADPPAGTLTGAPPVVPDWMSATQPDNPASSRPEALPLTPASILHPAQGPPARPPPSGAIAQVSPCPSVVSSGTPLGQRATDPPLFLPNTGLLGIPSAVVIRIRDRKFVDLGCLLPEALEWSFDHAEDDSQSKREDRRKKFPIVSFKDWALAFSTYMAVAVHLHPELTRPMVIYLNIVSRLAREVPGLVWQKYDRLFRQAAAVNPNLNWDRREPDIWLAAMAEQASQGTTPTAGATTPTSTSTPGKQSEAKGEICRRFSRGECVSQSACKFRHACMLCQSSSHAAKDCYIIQPPAKRSPAVGRR